MGGDWEGSTSAGELKPVLHRPTSSGDYPRPTAGTRVTRVRPRVVGHALASSTVARSRDSIRADHAELMTCRVLQDSRRPLASFSGRNGSRAGSDHLIDYRRRVFDE